MYNIHKVLKLRFSAFLDHFIHQFTFNSKAANKPSESRRPMAYLTFPLRHSCPQSPKIPNPPKTDALDHAPRRRRSRVATRLARRTAARRPRPGPVSPAPRAAAPASGGSAPRLPAPRSPPGCSGGSVAGSRPRGCRVRPSAPKSRRGRVALSPVGEQGRPWHRA